MRKIIQNLVRIKYNVNINFCVRYCATIHFLVLAILRLARLNSGIQLERFMECYRNCNLANISKSSKMLFHNPRNILKPLCNFV
jgi:hypothetical protein